MIAHVAGAPVEEALLPLLSGMGASLLLARGWLVSRVRRPRRPGSDHPPDADGPPA